MRCDDDAAFHMSMPLIPMTRSIQHWLWLFTSCIIHRVISFYRRECLCVCANHAALFFIDQNKYMQTNQRFERMLDLYSVLKSYSSQPQHFCSFSLFFSFGYALQPVLCLSLLFDIRTTVNNGILNLFAKDVERPKAKWKQRAEERDRSKRDIFPSAKFNRDFIRKR